jgi:LuxR family maltose regulon positive regulatory protein
MQAPTRTEAKTPPRASVRARRSAARVAAADLAIPRPPRSLVLRPRLFDALDEGMNGPLTLISAPPGAGKTALLASWLAQRPRERTGWISIRPHRGGSFWAEWCEALHRVVPEDAALASIAPPRGHAPAAFIDRLLNGFVELPEPVKIVVDDFHEANTRAVGPALEELLRAGPEMLRLVIATRRDPPLPLHILRASGELTELRARDLAFTGEEASELLSAMGFHVDPSDFAALVERTEGWAAGLRLFALSLGDRRPEDRELAVLELDERPAAEYLTAEVLDQQPEDLRLFLLRSSIVDRLRPDLADALTGRIDSVHLLESLTRDNIFIERLDTRPSWYRYHPLFGELLRGMLRYECPEELPGLHECAAAWYAEHGAPIDGVHHALAAGQPELAAACIARSWFELFVHADLTVWRELLRGVADRQLERSPVLEAALATIELTSGSLRRAARRLETIPDVDEPDPAAEAIVRFAHLLLCAQSGSFDRVIDLSTELLRAAESEPALSESAEIIQALALGHRGCALVAVGREAEARLDLDEALQLARVADIPHVEIASMGSLAVLELQAGRLRRAARLAGAAVETAEARGWGQSAPATLAYAALARVELEWFELDAAEAHLGLLAAAARAADDRPARLHGALLESAVCLARGGEAVEHGLQRLRGARVDLENVSSPPAERSAAYLEARLLAALGDGPTAEKVLPRALRRHRGAAELLAVRARLSLAAGDAEGALRVLDEPVDNAGPGTVIERTVLAAIGYRIAGREAESLAATEHALALGEVESIRRPFLEAGPAVRDVLADHLRHSSQHRWFASELRRILDGQETQGAHPAELLEHLSSRELDVLRYLQTMMSNADIAAELFVSVNTVKTHVKSIYRKLGATRRQDAVRRARQLQLI